MEEKYTEVCVRQIENKSGRVWQGTLRYKVANPDFVPRPASGPDTRTDRQRHRTLYKQVSKCFPREVNTKAKASRALSKWHDEMEEEAAQTGMCVREACEDLLRKISEDIEPATHARYETTIAHICTTLGEVELAKLTPEMIEAWLRDLMHQGYSDNTRGKAYAFLKRVCRAAVKRGDLARNPCDLVDRTPPTPRPHPNSLTRSEAALVVRTLDAMEPTPLVTAATLGLYMGLRVGEVCALRWCDVRDGAVFVRTSLGNDNGHIYVKVPKTENSKRRLVMSDRPAQVLAARRVLMETELAQDGIILGEREFGQLYVCGTTDGRFTRPDVMSKQWSVLSRALGLVGTRGTEVPFHGLRHTFATFAVAEHADIKSVSSYLGHASAAMTLDVYASVDERAMSETARIVEDALREGR